MEHAPHQAPMSADKQLEWDRAGEQLATHLNLLVQDTRDQDEGTEVTDSLPLLRASAKYLLTACDRCRRVALRQALQDGAAPANPTTASAVSAVRSWDGWMRQIGTQHGVTSPLRGLVEPVPTRAQDLDRLGLSRGDLLNADELLGRAT